MIRESRHGKYAEGTVRFQLAMPEALRDAIKARAARDNTHDAAVVGTALARYPECA
jgi:hypothetical protein